MRASIVTLLLLCATARAEEPTPEAEAKAAKDSEGSQTEQAAATV